MEIMPKEKITVEAYEKDYYKGTYTKIEGKKYTYYCASELFTLSAQINKEGTYPNSAYEAQYRMDGGGAIMDWAPQKTTIGKDGYSISVGIPWAASTDIEYKKDYCKVTDTSSKNTGKWDITYDYIKSCLGVCTGARRDVVFEATNQAAYVYWATKDSSYKLPLTMKASFSVVDSKSFPTTIKTQTVTKVEYYSY